MLLQVRQHPAISSAAIYRALEDRDLPFVNRVVRPRPTTIGELIIKASSLSVRSDYSLRSSKSANTTDPGTTAGPSTETPPKGEPPKQHLTSQPLPSLLHFYLSTHGDPTYLSGVSTPTGPLRSPCPGGNLISLHIGVCSVLI